MVLRRKLPSGTLTRTRQRWTISSGSNPKLADAARSTIGCIARFWERSLHRVFVGADESERYAATRIDELLKPCSFFPAFYDAMFHWFHNGREPKLRPTRAAIDEARRVIAGTPAQQAVVTHTGRVMQSLRKNR